ncbi:hypothetical protein L2E82_40724 [Cichorium intybus]|uniref:Uncharacterized protein n=1 Tax=Cichorium intybus TaxID=13427 RepID=A0ACB9ANH5_CICIN|nr:hypothetical protein L2E82_40724 [Cichorium intybus]
MENGNGGGLGGLNLTISCDDVISKLKDDGDFDRLRLKIIRKLKENEELRKNIVSIVKQSVALNRPGAENMKPRQLSDAIHQEVGGKVNEQISNGLWEIIRSPDGIKTEITETVKSIYIKLSTPKRVENPGPSGCDPKRIRTENNHQINGVSEIEPKEQNKETLHQSEQVSEKDTVNPSLPPGFSCGVEQKDEGDNGSDEDPDAPPGFG